MLSVSCCTNDAGFYQPYSCSFSFPVQVPKAGPRFEDGPVCSCSSLLISGCQSHEYSQDSPKGGQLTLALLDVIKTWKKEYPDQDISSRYGTRGLRF